MMSSEGQHRILQKACICTSGHCRQDSYLIAPQVLSGGTGRGLLTAWLTISLADTHECKLAERSCKKAYLRIRYICALCASNTEGKQSNVAFRQPLGIGSTDSFPRGRVRYAVYSRTTRPGEIK